ncbi:DUF192 domain-containing protein [Actinospongicola halichondriae]|uniref:DUF192 domain-containing protein n=1 Tax=Actinospongicola halichondriae TaxID=3236844 RepID=UPI003D532B32
MSDPLLDRPTWAPSWLPAVDDVRAMRWFRWIVGGVFAAGFAACVVQSADSPADPVLEGAGGVSGLAADFGTIVVDLVTSTGDVVELCLLHADEPAERTQGLKGVTDLEGHDGMLFSFDEDVQSNFVMVDTVTPLSISWWAADGSFVSGTDMTPCTEPDANACTRFPAAGPYRYAIEVFQGERPELGEGSTIEVRPGSSCQTP